MTETLQTLAKRIASDIRSKAPFDRFAGEIGTDMALAYGVQADVTRALLEDTPGRSIAGYKIAFNKDASLQYYGLREPCFAPIFGDQILAAPARLAFKTFRDLVIEPEIAAIIAADVDPEASPGALADAIGAVAVAIEIMDVRGAFAQDPSAAEAVAQRVHNAGAVIGAERADIRALDLANLTATLGIDGVEAGRATGAAPQHPLDAVRWLARRLALDGLRLEAGMVVLCGTHLPAHPVRAAGRIDIVMEPLGEASLRLD